MMCFAYGNPDALPSPNACRQAAEFPPALHEFVPGEPSAPPFEPVMAVDAAVGPAGLAVEPA